MRLTVIAIVDRPSRMSFLATAYVATFPALIGDVRVCGWPEDILRRMSPMQWERNKTFCRLLTPTLTVDVDDPDDRIAMWIGEEWSDSVRECGVGRVDVDAFHAVEGGWWRLMSHDAAADLHEEWMQRLFGCFRRWYARHGADNDRARALCDLMVHVRCPDDRHRAAEWAIAQTGGWCPSFVGDDAIAARQRLDRDNDRARALCDLMVHVRCPDDRHRAAEWAIAQTGGWCPSFVGDDAIAARQRLDRDNDRRVADANELRSRYLDLLQTTP